MIPILDFQRRSLTGPVMKSDDFDLAFAGRLRELVAQYEIKYDPEAFIIDDRTADAVFHAGVTLLADIGLYHMDTQRVVKFTEEEILEEFRCCAVIALPSRQETSPLVLGQALAAGRAVVSTPAGGVPWLLQHGVTGLIVPFGDTKQMALALRRLLDDPSLRKWMGERCREQARARFHSSVVAGQTLDLYRQLIERNNQ